MSEIAYCKIFPPIGIARIGDSQEKDGWFIRAEALAPSRESQPLFSYRDEKGKIKRQAARFHIYGFDANNKPVREVTDSYAEITWTVSLSNKKAAWFAFSGTAGAVAAHRGEPDVPRPRNASIGKINREPVSAGSKYVPDPVRREVLEIDGGTRSIKGRDKVTTDGNASEQYVFSGRFKKVVPVYLGELRTDENGRLIVLGGHGKSDAIDEAGASIRPARWIRNYANNDDWHDDTADGPVTAKVVLRENGTEIPVRGGAWVLVAPPDFAPDLTNLVTLYDVMEEVAFNHPELVTPEALQPRKPDRVFFDDDIAPILNRMLGYRWVNAMG